MYWFLNDDGETSWSSNSGKFESEDANISVPGCKLILSTCCKSIVVNTPTRFTIINTKRKKNNCSVHNIYINNKLRTYWIFWDRNKLNCHWLKFSWLSVVFDSIMGNSIYNQSVFAIKHLQSLCSLDVLIRYYHCNPRKWNKKLEKTMITLDRTSCLKKFSFKFKFRCDQTIRVSVSDTHHVGVVYIGIMNVARIIIGVLFVCCFDELLNRLSDQRAATH